MIANAWDGDATSSGVCYRGTVLVIPGDATSTSGSGPTFRRDDTSEGWSNLPASTLPSKEMTLPASRKYPPVLKLVQAKLREQRRVARQYDPQEEGTPRLRPDRFNKLPCRQPHRYRGRRP